MDWGYDAPIEENDSIVVEKIVYVDAPKPEPIIKKKVIQIEQPPKVITNVRDVLLPAPEQEVIEVPKYIERRPEVVEKIIYVQKPPPEPEVIEEVVEAG